MNFKSQVPVFFLVLMTASPSGEAKTKNTPICPGYSISSDKIIRFSINEKRLICGDKNVEAWTDIPVSQAQMNITTFLQERGYFFPQFHPGENGLLTETGQQTLISEVTVDGEPPEFIQIHKRRNVKGEVLTPKKMSDLEEWARNELKSKGYPCPEVTTRAYPHTGKLTLVLHPGPFQKVANIIEEPIEELNENVLRRYDAFDPYKTYDVRKVNLTATRTQDDGVVQSTHFTATCQSEGVTLTQKSIPGKPRLVVVGFGASTEEYGIAKASWKHARLGKMGSTLDVGAYGSFRKQEVNVESKWYFLNTPSRWFLNPLLSIRREDEPQYEFVSGDFRLTPAFTWDNQNIGLKGFFGPSINYTRIFDGGPEELTHFLSLKAQVDLMSHDYEYYLTDPRQGYTVSFATNLTHSSIFSDATAQQLNITGEALWNIGGYDPSLLILGIRGGLGTTVTERNSSNFLKLPPSFFYFLGGSSNLRGFDRQEIPGSATGALTVAFLGFEGRVGHVLPFNIEPIFFGDVGAVGNTPFDFDTPLYISPGAGLRWLSPIGVLRTTVSHGLVIGTSTRSDISHWQFYFSFGEEF